MKEYETQLTDFGALRKTGMGKESLKRLMSWLNEEKKLKISKKALIANLDASDIPEEIQTFFESIKNAMI